MVIEYEHATVEPVEQTPQVPFLDSLNPRLDEWHSIFLDLLEVENKYWSDNGVTKDHTQALVDIYFPISLARKKGQNEKVLRERITRRQKAIVKGMLHPGREVKGVEFTHTLDNLSPNDRSKVAAIYEELIKIQNEFRSAHRSVVRGGLAIEKQVNKDLQEWLEAEPANFAQFGDQIANTQRANLRRFLAFSQQLNFVEIAQKHKIDQTQNPSAGLVADVFDNLGEEHFKRKKEDPAWATIEFVIPIANDQIERMYTSDQDPVERKEILFGKIIEQIKLLGKPIPPSVRIKIGQYLDEKYGKICNQITIAINEYKPRANRNTPHEELVQMLSEELSPVVTKTDNNVKEKEPDTEKPPSVQIIVGNQICPDETSIRKNLERLFQINFKQLKNGYTSYLDAYAAIFSKIAGLRDNSPKHNIGKIKAVRPVNLSDGSKQPPLRLRLSNKDAPRIFFVSHDKMLIVIGASKHEDHTYDQLVKKGGFPDIDLSTFCQS